MLVQGFFKFPKSKFHDSAVNTKEFVEQRSELSQIFAYSQISPRFRVQNSIQKTGDLDYERPLNIHSTLMKKNSKTRLIKWAYRF